MRILKVSLILLSMAWLASCGGVQTQPTAPSAPVSQQSASTTAAQDPEQKSDRKIQTKGGGYYLDDGPSDNPPSDINNIPNAVPKHAPYLTRSNRPYMALGQQYVPMTEYKPYKKQGIATWYGKRYHGRQTSSGEVYDMNGMTAAHPILPIPSYVKVTNVNNGAYVILRVNDRGPFKHDRLIDVSYVAAHKLGIVANGSGKVEVELIDTRHLPDAAISPAPAPATLPATAMQSQPTTTLPSTSVPSTSVPSTSAQQFFVQAGAFKHAQNANQLKQKIENQRLESIHAGQNIIITSVYNNGLYKVRLGPYPSQQAADLAASEIRKIHNLSALVVKE